MTFKLSIISMIIFSILINVCIEMKPENENGSSRKGFYGSLKSKMEQSSIENFIKQGKKYIEENNHRKAAESFTKAIERAMSEPTYYEMRGRCYLQMEEWADALSDFKNAVLHAEKKSEGTTSLGSHELGIAGASCYKYLNDFEGAMWCFTQAIKRNPSEAVYFAYRGKCYLHLSDLNAAVADFKKTLTIYRGFSLVDEAELIVLADLLIASGKLDEPMEDVLFILGEVELGILANKLMEKNQFKGAIPYLTKAIELSPLDHEYHRNLGTCYFEQQNYDEAVTSFNEALRIKPNDDKALRGLFKTMFHCNKLEEARKAAQTLTDTQIFEIAKQYRDTPSLEFAILLFTEAIDKSSPELTWAYYKQRSECYLKQRNLKMAALDMQEAVKLRPTEENQLDLIHLLLEDDKKEEAQKEINSLHDGALKIISSPPRLDYHANANGCSKAIHYYTAAIERVPRHRPHYYEKRGDCYVTLEKFDEAIADFQKSVELDSNNVAIEIKLCKMLLELKRYNEARIVLKKLETKKNSLPDFQVQWVEGARRKLRGEEISDKILKT